MNLPKFALIFIAAVASASINATMIDFAGYSYNTATQIAKGKGLNWRLASSYDFSNGISTSGEGAVNGWRTATTAEVATVLNIFKVRNPSPINPDWSPEFNGDEYDTQGTHAGWGGFNHEALIHFYQMFGGINLRTSPSGAFQAIDLPIISFGIPDGHSLNRIGGFIDWLNYDFIPPEYRHPQDANSINPFTGAAFVPDTIMVTIYRSDISQGIGNLLLVREEDHIEVPEPELIGLLLCGLIAVVWRRRSTALKISFSNKQKLIFPTKP